MQLAANVTQRLPHCRSESCEDGDLVKKVGVDGCYEDEVVMGCACWVGSQIRQHGVCDGDESQDDSGDSSRHRREQPVQFFAARRSASRHRQRLAGLEECIPLFWRSTSTVYEEIPSVCSQSIDPIVDVGILLVYCGSCQDLCLMPMQHVLTLTMGVQLSKLVMSMHEDACRWQCWSVTITCMAISSRRHGCVDGSVLGPKRAEFEQVAAARRAKSSGENPLQRGAKMDIASGQNVLLCAFSEAV